MTNINLYCLAVIGFFTYACMQPYGCSKEEILIKQIYSDKVSKKSLPLTSIYTFEWDELYIISGPKFPDEVTEIIGFKYPSDVIPDDTRQYIFVQDSMITRQIASSCYDLSFFHAMNDKGFVKYERGSSIRVSVRKTNGGSIFVVEPQVK